MPRFIEHQPVGGFDLTAIGIALVIVMAIMGARWVMRIVKGKPKYEFEDDALDPVFESHFETNNHDTTERNAP